VNKALPQSGSAQNGLLHDIAEGLPADLDLLPDVAARTYEIYAQLRDLKQQLKTLETVP
jgi:Uncharacterized conserved small protein containing a coiled-coil domain